MSLPLKFKAKTGDLRWGKYDYPVTRSQKQSLDGIMNLFDTLLPRSSENPKMPHDGFYSQLPLNGAVIIGINHRSVTVNRHGRVISNQ